MSNIKVGEKLRVKGTKILGTVTQEFRYGLDANPRLRYKLKQENGREMIYDVEELTKNLET